MLDDTGQKIKALRKRKNWTLEQLGNATGVSKSTVRKWETGFIKNMRRDKLMALAAALDTTPEYLMGWDDNPMDEEDKNVQPAPGFLEAATVSIPVYGSVPAGVPVEAIQDVEGYIEIPADWVTSGRYLALRVSGSSMYPKYLEGDTVVVKQQDYAATGQDAVVYVNGYDATLKTVKHEPDGSITLKPVNPEYETKTYPASTVRVLGVVKRMVRDI